MGNAASRRERREKWNSWRNLDEVSQMLQAYAGDEPNLNMSILKSGATTDDIDVHEGRSKTKKRMIPTVFRWNAKHCRDVAISGSFNGWKERLPLVRSRDNFYAILELEEGRHEYKFYVDGTWRHDERAETSPNDLGTMNNIIHVRSNDLDVFEALAVETNEKAKKNHHYTNQAPTRKWVEEAVAAESDGPEVLPPHLLEVLLNQDTVYRTEPDMIAAPNHVMLNHLYALAIRDGIIVLGASHRYRKKFITTLFYKPCKVGG